MRRIDGLGRIVVPGETRRFAPIGVIFSHAVTTLISTVIALLLCRSRSRQIFQNAA